MSQPADISIPFRTTHALSALVQEGAIRLEGEPEAIKAFARDWFCFLCPGRLGPGSRGYGEASFQYLSKITLNLGDTLTLEVPPTRTCHVNLQDLLRKHDVRVVTHRQALSEPYE